MVLIVEFKLSRTTLRTLVRIRLALFSSIPQTAKTLVVFCLRGFPGKRPAGVCRPAACRSLFAITGMVQTKLPATS